jgi:hypothetical protein
MSTVPDLFTEQHIRPLAGSPWRVVEAQHLVSTRKLVDSLEEQVVLEEMIDASKPPDATAGRLHFLLSTPFRYPPLEHGSRFGARYEPSLWYGSESQRTLFAELAYYRLVFLEGSSAAMGTIRTWHTAFTARFKTSMGGDLTRAPFEPDRRTIASPSQYADSQALGARMRAAGVEAFRFPSARDSAGGVNVGIFVPSVFAGARPRSLQTWHCTATPSRIEVTRRHFMEDVALTFSRGEFVVEGRLPSPAV